LSPYLFWWWWSVVRCTTIIVFIRREDENFSTRATRSTRCLRRAAFGSYLTDDMAGQRLTNISFEKSATVVMILLYRDALDARRVPSKHIYTYMNTYTRTHTRTHTCIYNSLLKILHFKLIEEGEIVICVQVGKYDLMTYRNLH
jgi:hypothetical protein